MSTILAFFLFTFFGMFVLGRWCHNSRLWRIVDVIYYPLAAIGIILLFANSAAQRQLLELERSADQKKAELQALLSAKPSVKLGLTADLVDSSFGIIASIGELGAACKGLPKTDGKCIAAEKLTPAIGSFMSLANAHYASQELRLSSACKAAERLLVEIHNEDLISSPRSDDLLAHYKNAASKSFPFESLVADAEAYGQQEYKSIELLRRSVLGGASEAVQIVLSMYRSEADFGKDILQGLYPCIASPKASA